MTSMKIKDKRFQTSKCAINLKRGETFLYKDILYICTDPEGSCVECVRLDNGKLTDLAEQEVVTPVNLEILIIG